MRHVCRNDQDETYKRNEMNLHTQKTKPKNSSYGKHLRIIPKDFVVNLYTCYV